MRLEEFCVEYIPTYDELQERSPSPAEQLDLLMSGKRLRFQNLIEQIDLVDHGQQEISVKITDLETSITNDLVTLRQRREEADLQIMTNGVVK